MSSIVTFIEKNLKLKVNMEKSSVDQPWNRKFLGFSFTNFKDIKIKISNQSLLRVKQKIKELTSRKKSIQMGKRIKKINAYLVGWCGYYALADSASELQRLDKWIRRRLRMCVWKQWKVPRTRTRKLISLGINKQTAYEWGNSRKGYWRISHSHILNKSLGNRFWQNQGLKSLYQRYIFLRHNLI